MNIDIIIKVVLSSIIIGMAIQTYFLTKRLEALSKRYIPDPGDFRILKVIENSKYTLALIHYPNCVNCDGNKVLVYEGKIGQALLNEGKIDPHFEYEGLSPIARFRPDHFEFAKQLFYLATLRIEKP